MTPKETPDPDWDLLPRFPDRFFGLASGFDRRDLKRAYNRLLRRFKPEKFPEEFKRLRGAFEDLERRLQRSGGFGELLEDVVQPESAPEGEPELPVFDCVEELQHSTVEEVAASLAVFEAKSSDNWCQLALLRDELERDDPLVFYETLMEGVRSTQSAHSVSALLYEACQQTVPTEIRLPLLERMHVLCAEGYGELGMRPQGFFYMTERLWLDLAASMEFSAFTALLQRERAAFGDAAFEGYLGLLIRLVPRLGLRGDPEWVDEATELIDEHYHRLTPGAQNAVVEFDWVERYRSSRDWLVNGNSLRDEIDQALVKMSAGDSVEGPAAMAELLATFRAGPERLLGAFEPGEEGECDFFLDPLLWYAEANEAEIGGARRVNRKRLDAKVLNFARKVESRTDWSPLGILWLTCTFGTLALMLVIMVGLPCTLAVRLTDGQPIWRFVSIIGWLALIFRGSVFGVSLRWLLLMPSTRWSSFFSKRIYAKSWRAMLMEFLGRTRFPRDAVLTSLLAIDEPGISNCQFLVEHAAGDVAIPLYSLGLQFDEAPSSPDPLGL